MKYHLGTKSRLGRGLGSLLCLAVVAGLLVGVVDWRTLGLLIAVVLALGGATGFSLLRQPPRFYPRSLERDSQPLLTGALGPQWPAGAVRRRK